MPSNSLGVPQADERGAKGTGGESVSRDVTVHVGWSALAMPYGGCQWELINFSQEARVGKY